MEGLKALVLNSTFEPLQFTTARRALVLTLLGKAEAIETDGFFARTTSVTFRLPTVIKLNRYIKRPFRTYISFSKRTSIAGITIHASIAGSEGPI